MEKVLLIAIPQAEQVEQLAVKQHLRAVHIQPSAYSQSIGQLAGYAVPADAAGTAADELPPTGLLVFCGLRNSHMDRFLQGLRHAGIEIPHKAVLTPPTSTGRYSSWRGNWSGNAGR
ncbi:MAG: DUF3783 domain-containing protein [Ruminococcus sp.]